MSKKKLAGLLGVVVAILGIIIQALNNGTL